MCVPYIQTTMPAQHKTYAHSAKEMPAHSTTYTRLSRKHGQGGMPRAPAKQMFGGGKGGPPGGRRGGVGASEKKTGVLAQAYLRMSGPYFGDSKGRQSGIR